MLFMMLGCDDLFKLRTRRSVTALILPAAAARARVVTSRSSEGLPEPLLILGSINSHDLGWRPASAQEISHDPHGLVDMREERFVPRTQVVQPVFTVGCRDKAVFRTLSMTHKPHVALVAVARERIVLGKAKRALLV